MWNCLWRQDFVLQIQKVNLRAVSHRPEAALQPLSAEEVKCDPQQVVGPYVLVIVGEYWLLATFKRFLVYKKTHLPRTLS